MSDYNSRPKNGLRGLFQSLAKRRPQFQHPVHAAPVPAEVPEIERLIPPEIIGDEFHALIERLAQTESLQHVLEIGSSAGEGSTSAFVRGLRGNPGKPALYCMELSKTRFEALSEAYKADPFVRCFNVSSVSIEEFPSAQAVSEFYQTTPTTLNRYPLGRILGWLDQDVRYVRDSGRPQAGIEVIRQELGIEKFDMVLIDGSEFTGSAELDRVYGAEIILLDDTNAFKCHEARERLLRDPAYELIADNQTLRNGFSAFRRRRAARMAAADDLPVHFFTIVLNGEPFIRYHLDMLLELPFRWHWHIIEGVAELVHDTAWSVATGGRVDASLHERGRSKDGTSAYLDGIAAAHPDRITLYRKPLDTFWNGKRDMVSAPLKNIREKCLLWEIDSDELWLPHQIAAVRRRFLDAPERTAAYFWCDYFVGPEAVISTRYNYAQNPGQEWLRVWRYKPGDRWAAHEPPKLVRRATDAEDVDVAKVAPIMHDETEAIGAVFQHFAYVTEEQVRFKEIYYGYANPIERWRELQAAVRADGSVLLRNYFAWVTDDTMADAASRLDVKPLAALDAQTGVWRFPDDEERNANRSAGFDRAPRIIVDGVFFQHDQNSGIARVWRCLLTEWHASSFAQHIVVLDRGGKTPRIPGLRYRSIAAWNEDRTGGDTFLLQRVCDELKADLFVSSYYTTPISTPSVFVAHDMIPELLGAVSDAQLWYEKGYAIGHAALHICVSNSTRRDLLSFFPKLDHDRIFAVPHGVNPGFQPAESAAIEDFRERHRLMRPYFLLVGNRIGVKGYKNAPAFFRAFGSWPQRHRFGILCVGGTRELEADLRALAPDATVHHLMLSDEELCTAYSAAAAFICPSLYEGFGLPILEAMACGCPVVTALGSAMEEVSGSAAIHFDPKDPNSLVEALGKVVEESTRRRLVAAGLERARQFNWGRTAERYAQILLEACMDLKEGRASSPSPIWRVMREEQMRNQNEIARLRG